MKPLLKFILAYVLLLVGIVYGIVVTLGPQIEADNARWEDLCSRKGGIAYRVPNASVWLCVKPHSVIKID